MADRENTAAVMKRELLAPDRLGAFVELMPKHMKLDPEAFVRVALMGASKMPLLYQAWEDDKASFILAMNDSAQLGLLPGGPLQHAAIVPYRDKEGKYHAQFQPMYRGLIDLAKRGGELLDVEAEIVYEGDLFEYEHGFDPKFRHVQWEYLPVATRPPERGAIKCAYALFVLKGFDRPKPCVVNKDDLDKIQNSSKAKSAMSPWQTWPDEMRKKTAIKRGCKTLRLSPELAKAIELDNKAEGVVEGAIDTEFEVLKDAPPAAPLTPGRHSVKREQPRQEAAPSTPPVETAAPATQEPHGESQPEAPTVEPGAITTAPATPTQPAAFDRKVCLKAIRDAIDPLQEPGRDAQWDAWEKLCVANGATWRSYTKVSDDVLEKLLAGAKQIAAK